jgi:flagellar basal body rod protein FlgC
MPIDSEHMEDILLTGIIVSVDNIVNSTSTISADGFSYRYRYVGILSDLSIEIMEREQYKITYDPIHPDSFKDGRFKGYTVYPDIDVGKEQGDIFEMIQILWLLKENRINQ